MARRVRKRNNSRFATARPSPRAGAGLSLGSLIWVAPPALAPTSRQIMAHIVTLIDALPTMTSPEQHAVHQQTTPASFDIPPVLRHHEKGAHVQCNPSPAGFDNAAGLEAPDGIVADVYVTEHSVIVFQSERSKGFEIPFPAITLHAISRAPMRPFAPVDGEPAPLADTALAGGPCLYCQLDELAHGARTVARTRTTRRRRRRAI